MCSGCFLLVNAVADSLCIGIDSPRQGAVITAPQCTISVAACDEVSSVVCTAHFPIPDAKGDTSLLLGRITHSPYKLIWNTDDVPNQLYKGMSFSAEATLKNGRRTNSAVNGIFIANKPASVPMVSIPYASNSGNLLFERTIATSRGRTSIRAFACWLGDGVRFTAKIEAPGLFAGAAMEKLDEAGLEVCIDPDLSRGPYPPSRAFSLAVPLKGKPFKTVYRPTTLPGGIFDVATSTEPCACKNESSRSGANGFTAAVVVPFSLFGVHLPDSFGCNVIVRLPDDNNRTAYVSWIDAPPGEMYSPVLWASISVLPRPFWANPLLIGLLSFSIGLAASLVGGLVVLFTRRRSVSFEKFEQSEEEKTQSDQIYQLIDEAVTRRDLTLGAVAEKLMMPPKKIDRLIRKHKGKSFKEFVMFQRIEIAKERLRSSHSSEASIAESCGFKTVLEMEKYFKKFCRITPFSFRKENQVT